MSGLLILNHTEFFFASEERDINSPPIDRKENEMPTPQHGCLRERLKWKSFSLRLAGKDWNGKRDPLRFAWGRAQIKNLITFILQIDKYYYFRTRKKQIDYL